MALSTNLLDYRARTHRYQRGNEHDENDRRTAECLEHAPNDAGGHRF